MLLVCVFFHDLLGMQGVKELLILIVFWCYLFFRIYVVHDEVKDKAFELELSWVGKGM